MRRRPFSIRTIGTRCVLSLLLVLPQPAPTIYYRNVTATHLPTTPMPENGMDVEAADIDGDGDLDIIIANEFQPNVILINDGAGRFTNESGARLPNYNTTHHDSEDLALADFDRDGDLDLIVVSEDDRVHEYYLNDGTGRFTVAPYRLPDSEANAVAVGDLDGDSYPDVVIGNAGQDFVLINDRNGGFIDETFDRIPAEQNVTQDIELADLDGDGDLDMIIGNEDGNTLLINDGSGRFTDETAMKLPIAVSMETRKVVIQDVDNDGDLDIYFANVQFRAGKNRQDRLYINDGAGNFTDRTSQQLPVNMENVIDAKFVDIDLDGDPDIVLGGFPDRPLEVHVNDGHGRFTNAGSSYFPEPIIASALGIEVADLNGDGVPDLYICDRGRRDWLLLHVGDDPNPAGTGGGGKQGMLHSRLDLYPNFPNPFSRQTFIDYAIQERTWVDIRLFNSAGKHVATLVSAMADAGRHTVQWSAEGIPPGRYYCHVRTRDATRTLTLTVY